MYLFITLYVVCLLHCHGMKRAVSISACLNHRRENRGRAGFLSWYVQKAAGSLVADTGVHTALLVALKPLYCEAILQMTKSLPEGKTH